MEKKTNPIKGIMRFNMIINRVGRAFLKRKPIMSLLPVDERITDILVQQSKQVNPFY
jgi:hypothetical protein